MQPIMRYLRDPYYWRKALLRIVERLTRRTHVETELDRVLLDNIGLSSPPLFGRGCSNPGPLLLYAAPKFDYGNPARGYSYEENHFLPALVALGYSVIRVDSLSLVRRIGRRLASDLLVELAYRFEPVGALFVLFGDDFDAAAVRELGRFGVTTLNWFGDDHWKLERFSLRWAPAFSWSITTDRRAVARYREAGISNVILSQWGVNHRLYRPLPLQRKYDVTFIGQPHGRRRHVLAFLRRNGIYVEAWGYGWPRGKVSTREAVQIINQSHVNLNLAAAVTGDVSQIKGRVFEVTACGALLVTDKVEGLDEYFDLNEEVLTYSDVRELPALLRWIPAHPEEADRIRRKGFERTLSCHTYERRFTEVFLKAGLPVPVPRVVSQDSPHVS